MEIAHWLDWSTPGFSGSTSRVYLGHETDADCIPALHDVVEAARQLRDAARPLTLVTPLLTEKALEHVSRMIEALSALLGRFEVVCNDWGLLHWLTQCQAAVPSIGRLLTGQVVDPRMAAFDMPERQLPYERAVQHADGTLVQLRYRRPSRALMAHLRTCAIDSPEVLGFLGQLGLRRLEISNTLQGVEMKLAPGWNVTLHLPDVPIAIARHPWRDNGTQWLHPSFPIALHRRDNAIYYCNSTTPPDSQPGIIDRIVYRMLPRPVRK